jgi:hypothetical protein
MDGVEFDKQIKIFKNKLDTTVHCAKPQRLRQELGVRLNFAEGTSLKV